MSRLAREAAIATGELPHEFLLRISRGDSIADVVLREGVYATVQRPPSFAERVDAAKAAAPFFAPKLANIAAQVETNDSAELREFMESIRRANRGIPLAKKRHS